MPVQSKMIVFFVVGSYEVSVFSKHKFNMFKYVYVHKRIYHVCDPNEVVQESTAYRKGMWPLRISRSLLSSDIITYLHFYSMTHYAYDHYLGLTDAR